MDSTQELVRNAEPQESMSSPDDNIRKVKLARPAPEGSLCESIPASITALR